MAVEGEQLDRSLEAVLGDQRNRLERRRAQVASALNPGRQLLHGKTLEQSQHLDELSGRAGSHLGGQSAAQEAEAARPLTVLERFGRGEGPGLSLQQGPIVIY